jgi:tRNA-dihydrouridine synthase B
VRIPVIVNGDIDSPVKARAVIEHTRADALMIGRAAQGRPWIFRDVAHYLTTGTLLPEPAPAQAGEILLGHLDALHAFYGEDMGVRIARKHIGWHSRGRLGADLFRNAVNRATRAADQLSLTRDYFANLAADASRRAA